MIRPLYVDIVLILSYLEFTQDTTICFNMYSIILISLVFIKENRRNILILKENNKHDRFIFIIY